jgi:nucleoside-diphosphate-sugar epimerase
LKVLVTGGAGFLGCAIVERLMARGDEVRSLSRGYYPKLEKMGIEQVQGDLSDKSIVERACRDRDLVFHVASKFGIWGDYSDFYQTNVIGTLNVIDGCRSQNVSKLVYTSTPNVIFNGTPEEGVDESAPYPAKFPAHYPKTKALAEQKVREAADEKLKTIVLRPHFMWGPGDNHGFPRIISRAKRLKIIGDGKNLIDVTYIDDAVDAHLLAAEKLDENPMLSGNLYFISQGEPYPAWGMINNFLKVAGLDPITRSIPHRIAWLAGACLELIYTLFRINGEPFMTRYLADVCATSQWFNISAARKDLGFEPQITVEEGFRRLEEWLSRKYSDTGDR